MRLGNRAHLLSEDVNAFPLSYFPIGMLIISRVYLILCRSSKPVPLLSKLSLLMRQTYFNSFVMYANGAITEALQVEF